MSTALARNEANVAQITEALRALGLMQQAQSNSFARAKINGTNIEMGDEVFPSNQRTKAPAIHARLLDVPLEYHGMWFTPQEAQIVRRPDIQDRFCKSYYHIETQGGKYAEDGTSCETCPVNPFIKRDQSPLENGKKCSWRADVVFAWTDADGNPLDDRTWTLSLPTTSVIELKGLARSTEPHKGHTSDYNFMHKLAQFAIAQWPDKDPGQAILDVSSSLRLGAIVVGIRVEQVKSQDGTRSYPLIIIDPVAIAPVTEQAPAIPPPAAAKNVTPDGYDDLPF